MGNCWTCRTCCLSEEEKITIIVQNEINRSQITERGQIKVLLFGTRESGKTTFIKQMKIIHGQGFSEEDRRAFAKLVIQNTFTAMKALTGAMTTQKISYGNPQNKVYAQQFQEVDIEQTTQLNSMHVEAIHQLWADTGIKLCYSRHREYQLLDSTEYFMTNLDRIAGKDYIPTAQDVLRVQNPTRDINTYSFNVEGVTIRIVDVGGTRSERRKWVHCFENVTSFIFFASLSEYDQMLEENDKQNRMKESLALFNTIIHSPWFSNFSIILFLNKKDILEEKIQTSDLQTYFPTFRGKRHDFEEAKQYILDLYEQEATNVEKGKCKNIFSHVICATDTNKMRKVFSDVKDTLLINSLKTNKVL